MTSSSPPLSPESWAELFSRLESNLEADLRDTFSHQINHLDNVIATAKEQLSKDDWRALRADHELHDVAEQRLQRAYRGVYWSTRFDDKKKQALSEKCGEVFNRFPNAKNDAIHFAQQMLPKNLWFRLKDYEPETDIELFFESVFTAAIWEYFVWNVEEKCRTIAYRRIPMDEVLADTIHEKALEKLASSHYKRVSNSYSGKGSPQAYVITAYSSVFSDVIDSEYGKCRPPTWINRLGKAWSEGFKWLCCKKQNKEAFVTNAQTKRLVESKAIAEEIVKRILAKIPSCQIFDKGRIPIAVKPDEQAEDNPIDILENRTDQQIPHDVEILLKLLGDFMDNKGESKSEQQTPNLDEKITALNKTQWASFQSRINQSLTNQQLIGLRLLFQERLSVRAVADVMSLSQAQVITLRQRALMELSQAIDELGLFGREIFTALDQ